MPTDGHGTKWRESIAENFNRLSIGRTNVTDDRQTDDRRTGDSIYSERERELTFAKVTEPIEVPFRLRIWVDTGNHVLDGGSDPPMGRGNCKGKRVGPLSRIATAVSFVNKWGGGYSCWQGYSYWHLIAIFMDIQYLLAFG